MCYWVRKLKSSLKQQDYYYNMSLSIIQKSGFMWAVSSSVFGEVC